MGWMRNSAWFIFWLWIYDYWCLYHKGFNVIIGSGHKPFHLTIHPNDQIHNLKWRITWHTGILPCQQILFTRDQYLDKNDPDLSSVRPGTEIFLYYVVIVKFRYNVHNVPVYISQVGAWEMLKKACHQLFDIPINKQDVVFEGDAIIEHVAPKFAKLDPNRVYQLDIVTERTETFLTSELRYKLYLEAKVGYFENIWYHFFFQEHIYIVK